MKLRAFDYKYPEALVAQRPLPRRDASRMMVVYRNGATPEHSSISDLPRHLNRSDLLVINDSKVFPARLIGRKASGGKVEVLLLKEIDPEEQIWQAITNRKKRLKRGTIIGFDKCLTAEITKNDADCVFLRFTASRKTPPVTLQTKIEEIGLPPLPPYIKRETGDNYTDEDRERYQTVYAKNVGSAAAPTAGFHLTDRILKECRSRGVEIVPVTLHVGLDTFSPVRAAEIERHRMHGEEYFISSNSLDLIKRARGEGRRIVAVGTTTVRALESLGVPGYRSTGVPGFSGTPALRHTKLFIYPGYKFRVVDAMLTNFHQPRSTLLMMVSAFAGRELILQMYAEAIKERYRLFSYGDCMLIV